MDWTYLANRSAARVFAAAIILLSIVLVLYFVQTSPGLSASAGQYSILDNATGGDCTLIGAWNQYAKTCSITTNLTGAGIAVNSNGITIEGGGHSFDGKGAVAYGVYVESMQNVTIRNLTLNNFSYGVFLAFALHCDVIGNTTTNNSSEGIGVWGSNNNNIIGNTTSGNLEDGIGLILYSGQNTVKNNTISGNGWGVWLASANNNAIYNNNFIGNTVQADSSGSTGNIFNLGRPIGGNYWSNWTGPDANGDGFVDSPYVMTVDSDLLPWTTGDGWCGDPSLSLRMVRAYWPSFGEYTAGHLSVDYSITDNAAAAAYGVQIVGTIDTNGVSSAPPLPSAGDIAPHASSTVAIVYNVPPMVYSFRSAVYARATNSCGQPRSFPGPWPGV